MTDEIEVVQEETEYSYIDLIDNQLSVISTMAELDPEVYDTLAEDRIRTISNAIRIIHKSQRAILSVL